MKRHFTKETVKKKACYSRYNDVSHKNWLPKVQWLLRYRTIVFEEWTIAVIVALKVAMPSPLHNALTHNTPPYRVWFPMVRHFIRLPSREKKRQTDLVIPIKTLLT